MRSFPEVLEETIQNPVLYIPLLTMVLALFFGRLVFLRYREKSRAGGPAATHLLWWAAGIFTFGIGTFTEGYTTLFGWNEPIFRSWYIAGALLGGAPLAQGTVYLLLSRRTANIMAVALVAYIAVAALFVLLSPVDAALAEEHRLSGEVLGWQWVRLFSPFVNTYAAIFLIGGAAFSAFRYWRNKASDRRAMGNVLIAVGAILPGIGGAFTRAGYVEVLYVTELVGLILIFFGYRLNVSSPAASAPEAAPGEAAPAQP